jgi:hypothetical protein
MTIKNSQILKQSFKIAQKIERLSTKLHELIGATLELPEPAVVLPAGDAVVPRRRGRPPGSGRKQREAGEGASSLYGKPRPRSASGPLAPAVVKVLQRYNRPMKVTEILIGLEQDGYQWTAKNPKQTLYVRVGKLAGVRKIGDGLYASEGSSLGGIAPETVAPPTETPFGQGF